MENKKKISVVSNVADKIKPNFLDYTLDIKGPDIEHTWNSKVLFLVLFN